VKVTDSNLSHYSLKIHSAVALKSYSQLHGDVRHIMARISETNHMLHDDAFMLLCHSVKITIHFQCIFAFMFHSEKKAK